MTTFLLKLNSLPYTKSSYRHKTDEQIGSNLHSTSFENYGHKNILKRNQYTETLAQYIYTKKPTSTYTMHII